MTDYKSSGSADPLASALKQATLSQLRQPFDETFLSGMALPDRPQATRKLFDLAFFLGDYLTKANRL